MCCLRFGSAPASKPQFSDWNGQRKLLYCHSSAQSGIWDNPPPHCWEIGSAGLAETGESSCKNLSHFLAVWVLLFLFPLDNRARRKNVTGSLVQPCCISSSDVSPGIAASAPHTRLCPEPQRSEESQDGASGTWVTLVPERQDSPCAPQHCPCPGGSQPPALLPGLCPKFVGSGSERSCFVSQYPSQTDQNCIFTEAIKIPGIHRPYDLLNMFLIAKLPIDEKYLR